MAPPNPEGNYPVIAVVTGDGPTAVWHVDTDPLAKTGQLVGAWLVGVGDTHIHSHDTDGLSWAGAALDQSVLPMLIDGHPVVATDSGHRALDAIDPHSAAWTVVNIDETVSAMKNAVASYKDALKAENARRQAEGRGTLKGQTYPDIPAVSPARDAADTLGVDDPVAKDGWAWAEGIRRLVDTWNSIDAQRRAKATDYLHQFGGKEPHSIPLVTGETST